MEIPGYFFGSEARYRELWFSIGHTGHCDFEGVLESTPKNQSLHSFKKRSGGSIILDRSSVEIS